jgi:hypothetical protein
MAPTACQPENVLNSAAIGPNRWLEVLCGIWPTLISRRLTDSESDLRGRSCAIALSDSCFAPVRRDSRRVNPSVQRRRTTESEHGHCVPGGLSLSLFAVARSRLTGLCSSK